MTVYLCELCREILSMDETVVAAVRLHHLETFTHSVEAEGLGVFFHPDHWPDGPRYRFRARTTVAQALKDAPPIPRGEV